MADTARDMRFSSTLARGLAVLRAFRPSDDGLGNQDISQRTGIPKPTVCRLTHTLCADGYLTQGNRNKKYRLGPAALALGQIAGASFEFVSEATPFMQALANTSGALVGIAIQDADKMLICKTWAPDDPGRDWMEVGYRMPLLTSSSGGAYVSALTSQGRAALGQSLETAGVEEVERLGEAASEELNAAGFICVQGEARYSQTITAVAVPFWPLGMGAPVSFFAGSATAEMSEEHMRKEIGPALAKAVSDLRARIGASEGA